MSTVLDSPPTLAMLLGRLGDIAADRVRLIPTPGTATLGDLLQPGNDDCELIEGTLVEKPVGQTESFLAAYLGMLLNRLVHEKNLGYMTSEQGFFDLPGGSVRGPDLSFTSWESLPGRQRPTEPIPHLAPDMVVEILSPSNTAAEMNRKRQEYFGAGVRLVWEIDSGARLVGVYSAVDQLQQLGVGGTLSGAPVLPEFEVPIADLFGELDRRG